MALIKALPTDFGVDATYWNVLSIEVSRAERSLRVIVAGYLDGEARHDGRRPIAVATVTLSGPDFPGDERGIDYAAVYGRLKAPADTTMPHAPKGLLAGAMDG